MKKEERDKIIKEYLSKTEGKQELEDEELEEWYKMSEDIPNDELEEWEWYEAKMKELLDKHSGQIKF